MRKARTKSLAARLLPAIAATTVAGLLGVNTAQADHEGQITQFVNQFGAGDGLWHNPANWNNHGPPSSTTNPVFAFINVSGAHQFGAPALVNQAGQSAVDIYVGQGAGDGALRVTSGGELTTTGHLHVARDSGRDGTLTLDGTGVLNVGVAGTRRDLYLGHTGGTATATFTGGSMTAQNVRLSDFDGASTASSSLTITGGIHHSHLWGIGARSTFTSGFITTQGTGSGALIIGGNAVVTAGQNFFMRPKNGSSFTVTGSGASITAQRNGATGFEVHTETETNFIFDAGGITTVNLNGNANGSRLQFSNNGGTNTGAEPTGVLNVDVSAFSGNGNFYLFRFIDTVIPGTGAGTGVGLGEFSAHNVTGLNGRTASFSYIRDQGVAGNGLVISLVPEPASLGLLGLAGLGLMARRRGMEVRSLSSSGGPLNCGPPPSLAIASNTNLTRKCSPLPRRQPKAPPLMRSLFTISLVCTIALSLLASPAAANQYELVKVGNNAQSGRITFRGTGQPDGPRHITVGANPVITGNNIYAPDLIRAGDGWFNYFGGFMNPGQVNDRIYRGSRTNLEVNGPWSPQLAISEGVYEHVNDPSVVRDAGHWHMVYTAARTISGKFTDWINYSSSSDGINWTPNTGVTAAEIVMTDPLNLAGGTIADIARPSLVKTPTGWKMWFDAKTAGGGIASYLAHSSSPTPTSFQVVHRYADAGAFPGFFEPDIARRPDGTYVGVIQRNFATLHMVNSTDGINFTVSPAVVSASHPMFNRDFVSNPGLIYDDVSDRVLGLGFGLTNSTNLTGHDIGFTLTHLQVEVRSPGGTWHVFQQANLLDESFLHVFNFTSFDLVRIRDPKTNQLLLEQSFTTAAVGDIWEFRLIPEPSMLAPLLCGAVLLLRRTSMKHRNEGANP